MGGRRLPAALLAAALAALLPPPAAPRKLLVFLLDGFRFDYIDDSELADLPGFREIVDMGVKVDYMTPDFPSLSYPNYYTLMTGEYGRSALRCSPEPPPAPVPKRGATPPGFFPAKVMQKERKPRF